MYSYSISFLSSTPLSLSFTDRLIVERRTRRKHIICTARPTLDQTDKFASGARFLKILSFFSSKGVYKLDGIMATFASSLMTSKQGEASTSATPQSYKKSAALRPRRSNVPDFGTPIKVESSSPYRTPESSSKATALLARTPFGTPQKVVTAAVPTHKLSFQPRINATTARPAQPMTGRAQMTARIRALWLGSSAAASAILQAKGHLSYSALAKVSILSSRICRIYI